MREQQQRRSSISLVVQPVYAKPTPVTRVRGRRQELSHVHCILPPYHTQYTEH